LRNEVEMEDKTCWPRALTALAFLFQKIGYANFSQFAVTDYRTQGEDKPVYVTTFLVETSPRGRNNLEYSTCTFATQFAIENCWHTQTMPGSPLSLNELDELDWKGDSSYVQTDGPAYVNWPTGPVHTTSERVENDGTYDTDRLLEVGYPTA